MPIKECCTQDAVTVAQDASIREAAKCMEENNIGTVVVVKDESHKTPCGILTDRDIITRILSNTGNPDDLKVADVMTEDLLVVNEDRGIKETIDAMTEKNVRRAPVVNQSNEVIGIISMDDLFVLLAQEFHQLAELVKGQTQTTAH